MARGRMLSRDISLDEKVDALSDDSARLLFTWMIAHLDVEGRMYGDAQIFKSIVAPRRNYSIRKVEKYLTEMENFGLIERYSVDGYTYLFAPNFEKHQTGLRKDKEAQSKIPSKTTDIVRSKDGITTPQVKEKIKSKLKNNNIYMPYFESFWKAYPKHKSKGDAEKAFKTINPDEHLVATMLAKIEQAKKTFDWQKEGGQYIPYPATWLRRRGWEDEILEGEQSGAHQGHNQSRRLPKTYRTPEEIFRDG